MPESIFVSDGMTFRGEVPAAPGVHPAVSFTYRPATSAVRFEYRNALPAESNAVACRIVSRQVQTMSVGGEQPFRLTPEQCGQLHAGLFNAIFDYVMGYTGPAADEAKNSG
jgi:hypothetical protein